jgi:V-type H+-transporting ATPase subunit C
MFACLQVKFAEYTAIKQQFQAANRKTGGSLAIKDLASVVPDAAVLSTENITTVIVTVPTHGMNEFKNTYEKWSEMVVPRSALEVASDSEYTLVRVLVFRKNLEEFKAAARGKQCQV